MAQSTPQTAPQEATVIDSVTLHLPALLYGWFWFGLFLCGLLAPPERVAMLESGLITEGWHLSLMACCFGIPILGAYWLRMSGRWR